ncbi:3-dehydrosphinganine reductase tsc10a [Stylosanthes scabra]|uniref:3-dehydrosphinganine reductase tsc10a n=1 Tax=Stylosanthes scabra TaxID=79078 RepID=A0ABU6S884_9FABA|nr:3-dehydrosphinganine reductase tsc10a [Stylosanthes scabra]
MAEPYFLLLLAFPPLALLVFLYLLHSTSPPSQDPNQEAPRVHHGGGGSSGIGLALAHRAAAEGARVSIMARSESKLEEARNSIKMASGVEVAAFAADVRDYEAVKKAVDEAGPIDVLLLNHGVLVALEVEKQELSEIKFTMDVNLMGCFNMIKAALPARNEEPQ